MRLVKTLPFGAGSVPGGMQAVSDSIVPSLDDQSAQDANGGMEVDGSGNNQHSLSIGKRVQALKEMLTKVGEQLIRQPQNAPLPHSLPSRTFVISC